MQPFDFGQRQPVVAPFNFENRILLMLKNGCAVKLSEVPRFKYADFRERTAEQLRLGQRIASWFADGEDLYMIMTDDASGDLLPMVTRREGVWESLSVEFPQANVFERELAEDSGLEIEGSPWAKPLRKLQDEKDFYKVAGDGVHEVGVGPVHAGVIEPGHFRFQCYGEKVLNLEITLGYQHRGIEKKLIGAPDKRTVHYIETAAGDTTSGHTTAYCMVVEALAGFSPEPAALKLRALALELERMACHTGDLGAISGDIGYLPTMSFCGRLRGDFLNLTAMLCGNRFSRGLIRPGGIRISIDRNVLEELRERLNKIFQETKNAVSLLWHTPSVLARLELCGILPVQTARLLGTVGPAARASGLERDVRSSFPVQELAHKTITGIHGDVYARARVRWLEMKNSREIMLRLIDELSDLKASDHEPVIRPGYLAAALVEGWRGEICHTAITDSDGRFKCYKIVDPSFHNWPALAQVLRNGQISNFPLCNKSFNLSYCGHDL